MNSKKIITVVMSAALIFLAVGYGLLAGRIKTMKPDVVVFGDSLIGNDRTETSVTAILEADTGMKVFNAGIGGSLLSKGDSEESHWNRYNMVDIAKAVAENNFEPILADIPYEFLDYNVLIQYLPDTVKGISKIKFSKVKYIVVENGINDCIGGVSEEEFEEALETVIDNLKKAAPKTTLIVVSPGYSPVAEGIFDEETVSGGKLQGSTEKYVEIERRVCLEKDVSFIDIYHNGGINADNYEAYLYDGLHTNAAGNKILADLIRAEMK